MTSTARSQEMALRRMLDARRVAIVGASDREGSAGFRVASYLKHSGFTGTVIYVNPSARTILGENPVASLRECAGVPIDHAMLLIPAREVPSAVRDAASVGVASLSIFAAGYAERDAGGRARQDELVGVARDAGMRLLGPNCLGYINMHTGLTMTTTSLLEEVSLPEGNVTIITQSGGAGMHIAASSPGGPSASATTSAPATRQMSSWARCSGWQCPTRQLRSFSSISRACAIGRTSSAACVKPQTQGSGSSR